MNRRQVLAGLGMAASGSAVAVGTGAFTSVEADRSIGVAVADEDTASYLALDAVGASTANGAFAANDGTGKAITFDFNDEIPDSVDDGDPVTNYGGEGVGKDSTYEFDNVFEITNQGTQEIKVTIEELTKGDFEDNNTQPQNPSNQLRMRFYAGSDASTPLHNNPETVGVGNSQAVGVEIKTGDVAILTGGAYGATALVEADPTP